MLIIDIINCICFRLDIAKQPIYIDIGECRTTYPPNITVSHSSIVTNQVNQFISLITLQLVSL